MMAARSLCGVRGGCQRGSILLLVLFMCLAVAVVVQAVSAVVLCAERSVIDESVGRGRLAEKDQGLVTLRQISLTGWEPSPWRVVWERTEGPGPAGSVEGSVSELEGGGGWVLEAAVRQEPTVSALEASAWLERGRDGIDLPLAALVAETVTAAVGRSEPWLATDGAPWAEDAGVDDGSTPTGTGQTVGYVVGPPDKPLLGEGCALLEMREPWRLDPAWAALESRDAVEARTAARMSGSETEEGGAPAARGATEGGLTTLPAVAPGPRVVLLDRDAGRRLQLSDALDGQTGSPEEPILVLVTDGAELDARGVGDLYGVLLVDNGSLLLDGTTVHGAVFATGIVDFGGDGRLLFSRGILRWATDRSLQRARLVPGTRWEGME